MAREHPPANHATARRSTNAEDQGRYPVTITGRLDPDISRWLWLLKWLLAIPHYVVLTVLFFVAAVLSVVAWFAILFTGRYPRRIFDLNVGIYRWTWRTTFYSMVLGTDRYPPFSLRSDSSYPADFDVEYRQDLSRLLVLVKSWLLALPHWLIVSLFTGDAFAVIGDNANIVGTFGISGIITLAAGCTLLITGRYPSAIFDLLMGIWRWTFRVIAYAGLMRDEYPPFRLDQGGEERSADE